MGRSRELLERLLFPGAPGQRRRHMRFFLLALILGVVLAAGVGVLLYFLNVKGRA